MTCINLDEESKKYNKIKDLLLEFTKNKLCTITDIQKYLNKNNIDTDENKIINLVRNDPFLFWPERNSVEFGENIHYKTLHFKHKKSILSGFIISRNKYVSNPDEELKKHIHEYLKPIIDKKILIDKTNYEKIRDCSFGDIGFIDGVNVYKVEMYTTGALGCGIADNIRKKLIGKVIK